jgi:hypothetical protein
MMTPNIETCDVCGQGFQFGPSIFRGRGVGTWGIKICDGCEKSNHDGLVPQTHRALLTTLQRQGVELTLNNRGWIDIPE